MLQLAEEVVLALDDPVRRRFPACCPRPSLCRNCSTTRAACPTTWPSGAGDHRRHRGRCEHLYTDDELIAAALALPWANEPGDTFSYSNTNYVVLGRIIEKVTGVDTAEALDTRIFGPAGMKESAYEKGAAMPAGALSGFLLENGELTDVTRYEPSIFSSSGAVVSTVGDLNRFFRALFDGTLLAPGQVSAMQEISASGYGVGLLAGGDACDAGAGQLVYGQKGNGFGYEALSFSSPDGQRQVTIAWTASAADPAADPLDKPASAALVTALSATCRA